MSSDPLDRVAELIYRLEKELGLAVAVRGSPKRRGDVSPAWWLRTAARADGGAWVVVDEGRKFPLPPKLARLLEVLAADTGRCADGTVEWKPVAMVRSALKDHPAAVPPTARALNQRTYRLRQCLDRAGVDPRLVQRDDRNRALRFVLRPGTKNTSY